MIKKPLPRKLGTLKKETKQFLDEELEERLPDNQSKMDMFEEEFGNEMGDENFLEGVEFVQSERTSAALNIVNSESGKRVTLSKKVLAILENPDVITLAINKELKMLILTPCDIADQSAHVLKGHNQSIVYSSNCVNQLTQLWKLNFEERSSMSIGFAEKRICQGKTYVVITQ
ncbi:hypothetical protein JTI58_08750 [Lysinibacillus fusiformis]|uniref:hypothetical protein n=1 Tax=Lysinibacillus fusiformis TaxID=28031 RepID=UPI00196706F1|nr:hypothetical protein [Lysinibacillus fusiformis]QSB11703.1 hypothetical protein JTI58_08750 [Lysinibacillus fusiformis]